MIGDILRLIKNFVLVIGPKEAGKTSILKRMVTGSFESSQPTYGLNEEFIRKIRVIEIGGQENYQNYWRIALEQNPVHIFFVIDITKAEELDQYKQFLNSKNGESSFLKEKLTLCVNKSDLIKTDPDYSSITDSYIICSAKSGEGILDILELIATFGYQEKLNLSDMETGKSLEKRSTDSNKIGTLLKDYEGKI